MPMTCRRGEVGEPDQSWVARLPGVHIPGVATTGDGRVVHEHVSASPILLDEAETLFRVEPVHGTGRHGCLLDSDGPYPSSVRGSATHPRCNHVDPTGDDSSLRTPAGLA